MNLALEEEFKAKIKESLAKKAKYQSDGPKLYWLIRRNLSEKSTDKVREHLAEKWEEQEKHQDPVQLWTAIKTTHITYSTGNPFLDKQSLRQRYAELKMLPGWTLLKLKTEMTALLKSMNEEKMHIPSPEDQAADYIQKLDHRWSTLKAELANDYVRGVSNKQPKTLTDAWTLASQWNVVVTSKSGVTSSSQKKTNDDNMGEEAEERASINLEEKQKRFLKTKENISAFEERLDEFPYLGKLLRQPKPTNEKQRKKDFSSF